MTSQLSIFEGDFFADEVIANPLSVHREMRDLGPIVWMSKHDICFINIVPCTVSVAFES